MAGAPKRNFQERQIMNSKPIKVPGPEHHIGITPAPPRVNLAEVAILPTRQV